jgi:cobalt-zinc-cadmium resistance protein CzcA
VNPGLPPFAWPPTKSPGLWLSASSSLRFMSQIFFLEGLEGRMFRPMAFTVCSALFGALLLALIAIPVFTSFAFGKGLPVKSTRTGAGWMECLADRYQRLLAIVIRYRKATVAVALLILVVALWSLTVIGTEFMPQLD